MFPHNNEKSKEALQTLILVHKQAIERWQERLNDVHDNDSQALLVRSQIEFLILNAENLLHQHESQMSSWEEMEKFQELQMSVPGVVGPPGYVPYVPAPIVDHPSIKAEEIEVTLCYYNHLNPQVQLVLYRMTDGRLVDPLEGTEREVGDGWTICQETKGRAI